MPTVSAENRLHSEKNFKRQLVEKSVTSLLLDKVKILESSRSMVEIVD